MYEVLFYGMMIAFMRWMKRKRMPKPRALCAECSFAHIQYGTKAQRAIFCTYGGGVRPVGLDILYCTDFRDRNAVPRLVPVGFIREIVDEVAVEAAATARERRS